MVTFLELGNVMSKSKATSSTRSSKEKQLSFDFDRIPIIIGSGISVIERELKILTEKSEKQGLSETESKILISYLSTLREIKKDYLSEVAALQKELKSYSTEELTLMLQKEVS